jgi:eukaryotic-like serine/threonine-protein kinase
MDFQVGQTFGDYTITALAGAGSMGRVYKVENRLTKRTEAMKVLAAENATEIQVKRFEREVRVLARLRHPNIAVLYNAFHHENQLMLLVEFVEGRTLEKIMKDGRLPLGTGIEYIRQMLHALGHAHEQGVVHRDVTPANVIITAAGEVKLTDFGLSKSYGDSVLTNYGEILGSLPYLAPEQLKGATHPDPRSDLYSVGAILYEHLTGQKPFGANRKLAAVLTDSEAEPQAPSLIEPSLSRKWDEIVRRALARDRGRRYQSAEEFVEALATVERPPRAVGWGVAIAAAGALALAGAPVIQYLRMAGPPVPPVVGMHIKPPVFAAEVGPKLAAVAVKPMVQHTKRIAPIAPTVSAEVVEPLPAPEMEARIDESPAPKQSKSFWNRLNVFKKKKSVEAEKQ